MKRTRAIVTAAVGVVAAGGVITGAALANAAQPAATVAYAGVTGEAQRSTDTAVTGDEKTKVAAAVTAKDSTVTVTEVRKDSDGSYDLDGTKAGAPVAFEVSSDLKTVTARGDG